MVFKVARTMGRVGRGRKRGRELGLGMKPFHTSGRVEGIFKEMLSKVNPFASASSNLVTGNLTNFEDDYEILEELGSGRYGTVYSAKQRKPPYGMHAIKTIPKSRVNSLYELKNEIELLRGLDHENIVKYITTYEDTGHLHLVTELCQGGELFDRIIQLGSFSEVDAARLTKQILEALRYCHSRNIVHRDIKPENLLFKTKDADSQLCLVDFGMGRTFSEDERMMATCGSPAYVAPEVLDRNYSEKCDLWSTGVILYVLLCGHTPFNGDTDDQIMGKVAKGSFSFQDGAWKNVSDGAVSLVNDLLQLDVSKRPSAQEALLHPWFAMVESGMKLEPLQSALENLKVFNSHRKFKRAALGLIAQHLMESNNDGILELRRVFQSLDTDGDGLIPVDVIIHFIKENSDHKDREVQETVHTIDRDKSGSVDIEEFIAAAMQQSLYLKESCLNAAFAQIDKDGNGTISKDELRNLLGSSKDIDDIMDEADRNKDGVIDYSEFTIVMRKRASSLFRN